MSAVYVEYVVSLFVLGIVFVRAVVNCIGGKLFPLLISEFYKTMVVLSFWVVGFVFFVLVACR